MPADATGTSLLKLKQAQLAVQTAQENLDTTTLTAPFDGTITQATAVSGDVVASGAQVFRIDNLSSLVVAVQVTEIDINSIKTGQPATIIFDAIPNKTYTGTVVHSDLAGTVGANSVNFSVTVQITNADALIKPGMAANVTIVTNKVDNALLVPSTSIFTDTTGQQYVYLIQNGVSTTVPVTVGSCFGYHHPDHRQHPQGRRYDHPELRQHLHHQRRRVRTRRAGRTGWRRHLRVEGPGPATP